MKAVINAVTEASFGKATVVAVAVEEAAVAWATEPTATTSTDAVTLSGSTDVAGYVYCMVSKAGEVQTVAAPAATTRRLADDAATTDAAATDDAATTDAAAAEPAKEEAAPATSSADPWLSMLTDDSHKSTNNFQRVETKDPFTFTLKFTGVAEDSKYGWGCQATSLNPDAKSAVFKSQAVGGFATTAKTPAPPASGDAALWSSFFAAIIMIVGVFFY